MYQWYNYQSDNKTYVFNGDTTDSTLDKASSWKYLDVILPLKSISIYLYIQILVTRIFKYYFELVL